MGLEWQLTGEIGLKTVYYRINHTGEIITLYSDSIQLIAPDDYYDPNTGSGGGGGSDPGYDYSNEGSIWFDNEFSNDAEVIEFNFRFNDINTDVAFYYKVKHGSDDLTAWIYIGEMQTNMNHDHTVTGLSLNHSVAYNIDLLVNYA